MNDREYQYKKANYKFTLADVKERLDAPDAVKKHDYKVYDTFLEQDADRWKTGRKAQFQQQFVSENRKYFAYIKFYLDGEDIYAIVAGKSGSYIVNKSRGFDLSFSFKRENRVSREWLEDNKKVYCQTMTLVVYPREQIEDRKLNRRKAFEIERELKEMFGLLGS